MSEVYVIEEFNDFARYADALAPTARRIVSTTIHRIEARVKASLSGPRHGRTYRRGAIRSRRKADRGAIIGYKFHRASAPGEPPATDTGNLANSVGARMIGSTEGEVTVNAQYGAVLELGGVRMAPRPYFAPAVQKEWPEFLNALRELGET